MYEAARKDDAIEHSLALEGLIAGVIIGAIIGVATVATGGVAAVVIAAATAASTGGFIGQVAGGFLHRKAGKIVTGAGVVQIGGKPAARAVADKVDCHAEQRIAQGSMTVFIEDYAAARIDDKTECDGKIAEGHPRTRIGLDPGTYLKIGSEVPWWLEAAVAALSLPGIIRGIARIGIKTLATRGWGFIKNIPKVLKNGVSGLWKGAKSLIGHPVDVATGNVVDAAEDLVLPGPIPVVWERTYSSAQASEETSLGVGGWTLSWEQWISSNDDVWILRAEEGRDVYFEKVPPGASTYHRRERLTLTAKEDGQFSVYSHVAQQTRRFTAAQPGGRALLRSVEDRHGNVVVLYYDGEALSRIEDTAGRHINIRRDPSGIILRVEAWARGELVQWVDYAYHLNGELASTTDALGHSDAFEYDAEHRMIKTTLKNGVSFYYAYDPETERCIKTWGDGGLHTIELKYDIETGRTEVSGNNEPRIYYWDDNGLVRREETLDGRCLRVCDVDDDGFVIAEGPTEQSCARHEYDERGNRVKTIDPAGATTTWTFDGDVPVTRTDPDGQIIRFEHDDREALIGATYPTGVRYRLGRDPHGRVTSVYEDERPVATFAYDREHNIVAETGARGGVTSYAYDPLGRPVERRDALGRQWQIERDRLGRPEALHTPDGTVSRTEYDALGNATRTVDALGQVTEMEYAGTGVLTRFIQPNGHAYSIAYDCDERLTGVENPIGEKYSYEYDAAGRVVSEHTFDGRKLGYRYSEDGNLSAVDYSDGMFRIFKRDARGLVVGDTAPESDVYFERDLCGRITKAVLAERSGRVVVEIKRDSFGRIIEEIQNGRPIRYVYDTHGRRTERTLPDGGATRYGYDEADSLAWVEHDGRRFSFERDRLGREIARRAGSGFEMRNTYDEMDRLVERQTIGGTAHGILSRRAWSYDTLGRVREIIDSRWGTTTYSHDPIGQLLSARRGAFHEDFNYDPAGSLSKLTSELSGSGMADDWEIESGNRLARTHDAEYTYDRRGRRIRKVALTEGAGGPPGETSRYAWDARDRLREITQSDGTCVLFTYDAFGRRVRKEVLPAGGKTPRRTVEFLWDGDELAADIDSAHGSRTFVHEPGTFVPMLQAEQGEVFAVVNDHLGMPKELIDQEGRIAWSAAHSAWGRVVDEYRDPFTKRTRAVESPFRLLGQYADRETGLCHTKFRYFDPAIGRWCSPDPIGIMGGHNLYSFDGSPQNGFDALGLCFGNGKAQQSLFHYTTEAGRRGIIESGQIWASQGIKNARYGSGQYFTDIAPEAIGGLTKATVPAGKISLGQLSSKLFRVPWNTNKLASFVEVEVSGLGATQVAPHIWLIEGENALSVFERVIRSGATLP